MPEAVIVSAVRTPIGTARKGTLRDTNAFDLADHVVGAVAEGLDATHIDDVVLGEGRYGGGVVARHAAVTAGLTGVAGAALNRHCAAGMSAVQTAAAGIRAGMDELVIAGGVNSDSTAPRARFKVGEDEWIDPWVSPSHPDRPDAPAMDMSITVGWNAAVRAGLSRAELDAWALRSHRNAIAAIDEGRFKEEIVPIETPHGLFDTDEHPRRDTNLEKLARLKVLHPEIEGFSITAGNACGANDGAAALAVARERLGLPALAHIRSWASVGVDPAETGMAPIEAITKAVARAGISLSAVRLIEINEAFASVPIAAIRALDLDPDIVNVNGSGCSLGHPVGAAPPPPKKKPHAQKSPRGGGVVGA
ncbi:thiolase family protein, partial [Nocardia wallacei]|uniref:thiolase family protein n=1 Tax=Nocardia wallacei TaxID=480035 RepID=UPI002454B547